MSGQIERIAVFVEVATRGSFASAARHLKISASAATRHVSQLETELGAQLLVRTTRSVSPTLAGQAYLERARHLLRELDRANAQLREDQNSLSGTLRLSAPLSLGLRFLPDVIARFRILHPEIDLRLDLTDRFIDILSEDYDMALRISGPPSDKSTIWRKICSVPRGVMASPGYLERAGRPETPEDLATHDCLAYSHFAGGRDVTMTHAGQGTIVSVAPRYGFECNNGDMLAEMAARHEGLAILPRFIAEPFLAEGKLVQVMEDWLLPPIWLTAFFPPYDRLPAKVRTMTEFIEAAVGEQRGIFIRD
ncbi:MAG: LysR family transcriptional regulator [Paracoccaceae bacterium]